ncbi:unnamed protein product [Merluccius merluccius]
MPGSARQQQTAGGAAANQNLSGVNNNPTGPVASRANGCKITAQVCKECQPRHKRATRTRTYVAEGCSGGRRDCRLKDRSHDLQSVSTTPHSLSL